jgi:trigger factor
MIARRNYPLSMTQTSLRDSNAELQRKSQKNAKIPGFRPGKAPYQVIVNQYGEGAVVQEAIDILIDDDYSKILKEAEIEPSGVGTLESMDNYDPPKFVLNCPFGT